MSHSDNLGNDTKKPVQEVGDKEIVTDKNSIKPGKKEGETRSLEQNLLLFGSILSIISNVLNIAKNIDEAIISQIYYTVFKSTSVLALICTLYIARSIKNRNISKWIKISYALLAIFILVTVVFTYVYIQPSIKITSPDENSIINKTIDIEGKAKRIPEGDPIWAVVYAYDPTNRYYPQSQLIYPAPDGLWRLKGITVGADKDHGRKFDIIACSADDKADKIFKDALKPPWQGLEKLPSGTKVYDRITVTRA